MQEEVLRAKKIQFKPSIDNLHMNLVILYILNVSELVFGKILIYLAPISSLEEKFSLNSFIHNEDNYIIKLVVIGLALIAWGKISRNKPEKYIKISNIICSTFICIYLVNISIHIINILLYLSSI